jgi:ABC-type uncharacterized transport system permease subunit
MLNSMVLLVSITIMYSTPLIFGALGGLISERSGVTNIGIEGMMSIGAATAVCVAYTTGNPWIGFLAAGLAGGLLALLHGVASIAFKANQTVSGIAINLLGPGIALFMARLVFGMTNTPSIPEKLPKILGTKSNTAFLKIFNVDITVIIALLLTITIWFVLYKTKWGLRIRSVGEHPQVADTLGINVYHIRYICVILSGILGGFGGAAMTLAIISNFTPTAISGHGFIALAAVIFGKWKPFGVYGACIIFGFAQALTVILGGAELVPSQILAMLPYVLTIIVLIFFVGNSTAPKASGVAYESGKR